MCLIITIHLIGEDVVLSGAIAQAATSKAGRPELGHRRSGILNIAGPDGGCGCSFLTDSAHWDAPAWDMKPDTLQRLSDLIREVGQRTTGSFRFDALWIGESPRQEKRIRLDELIRLVETSELGTTTRYLVEREDIDGAL